MSCCSGSEPPRSHCITCADRGIETAHAAEWIVGSLAETPGGHDAFWGRARVKEALAEWAERRNGLDGEAVEVSLVEDRAVPSYPVDSAHVYQWDVQDGAASGHQYKWKEGEEGDDTEDTPEKSACCCQPKGIEIILEETQQDFRREVEGVFKGYHSGHKIVVRVEVEWRREARKKECTLVWEENTNRPYGELADLKNADGTLVWPPNTWKDLYALAKDNFPELSSTFAKWDEEMTAGSEECPTNQTIQLKDNPYLDYVLMTGLHAGPPERSLYGRIMVLPGCGTGQSAETEAPVTAKWFQRVKPTWDPGKYPGKQANMGIKDASTDLVFYGHSGAPLPTEADSSRGYDPAVFDE